jgi:hypothetical protein
MCTHSAHMCTHICACVYTHTNRSRWNNVTSIFSASNWCVHLWSLCPSIVWVVARADLLLPNHWFHPLSDNIKMSLSQVSPHCQHIIFSLFWITLTSKYVWNLFHFWSLSLHPRRPVVITSFLCPPCVLPKDCSYSVLSPPILSRLCSHIQLELDYLAKDLLDKFNRSQFLPNGPLGKAWNKRLLTSPFLEETLEWTLYNHTLVLLLHRLLLLSPFCCCVYPFLTSIFMILGSTLGLPVCILLFQHLAQRFLQLLSRNNLVPSTFHKHWETLLSWIPMTTCHCLPFPPQSQQWWLCWLVTMLTWFKLESFRKKTSVDKMFLSD